MKNILKFIYLIIIVVAANLVVSALYFRIDLTSEKRHTLNKTSSDILNSLDKPVIIEVFLEGDLPPSFLNLKKRIADLLSEYENSAQNDFIVKWIDPSIGKSEEAIKKKFQLIANSGIRPFTLQERKADGKLTQRVIFPGAFISIDSISVPVNFLQQKQGASLEENLLLSEQLLEYECTAGLFQLTNETKQRVAFITDWGTLSRAYIRSAEQKIAEFYPTVFLPIEKAVTDSTVKVAIIAKPTKAFSEVDKYYIDQFVQSGRSILWLIDGSLVSMDSLAMMPVTMAVQEDLRIDDLLFKYGVRLDYSLILDNQCATIPVNIAPTGEKPQFNPAPWFYAPLLSGLPKRPHPITNKLNLVRSEFISVLDTVFIPETVKRSVLLTSSSYSRVHTLPTPVGFDILDKVPNERFFNRYKQTVAVIHEGVFPSLFSNRKKPNGAISVAIEKAKPAKQIFVSDGDIIRNAVRVIGKDTIPIPLGQDKYTGQSFGNAEFVLNSVNYLIGDEELLSLRARELKLRLLDRTRIVSERKFWQTLNIGGPMLLLLIGGLFFFIFRKRKYTK